MANVPKAAEPKLKRRIYLGWWVIVASCFAWFPMGAMTFVTTMIFPFLQKERGWTATDLSLILACGSWGGIVAGPINGWICNHIGNRKSILIGVSIAALGCLGYMMTTELWQVLVFRVIFVTVGLSLGQTIGLQSIPRKWFAKYGAFGTGILYSNWAFWFAVVFPLTTGLAAAYGWRNAILMTVIPMWAICMISTYIGIWNSPEEKGLHPDGVTDEEWGKLQAARAARAKTAGQEASMTLREAFKTPQFYLLALCNLMSIEEIGLLQGNTTLMGLSVGMPAALTGLVGTALMVPAIITRAGSAFLADKFGKRRVLIIVAVLSVAVLIFGWLSVHDSTSLYVLVILCGIVVFSGAGIFPAVTGDLYGRKNLPQIMGFQSGITSVINGFITIGVGYINTATGGFNWMYFIMAMLFILQLVCLILLRPTNVAVANQTKL